MICNDSTKPRLASTSNIHATEHNGYLIACTEFKMLEVLLSPSFCR